MFRVADAEDKTSIRPSDFNTPVNDPQREVNIVFRVVDPIFEEAIQFQAVTSDRSQRYMAVDLTYDDTIRAEPARFVVKAAAATILSVKDELGLSDDTEVALRFGHQGIHSRSNLACTQNGAPFDLISTKGIGRMRLGGPCIIGALRNDGKLPTVKELADLNESEVPTLK